MATDLQDREDQSTDPIQHSYNDEFNNLTSPEHYAKDAADPSDLKQAEENGNLYNPKGDRSASTGGGKSSPADAGDIASREKGFAANGSGRSLFNPSDIAGIASAGSPLMAAKALLLRNKGKGALAGGGITALIITLALGIGAVSTFELETIEKNLLTDVSKIEKHFEQRRAQKDFQKAVQRLLRKARGTPAEKAQIAAEDAAGGELTKATDNFDITSPETVADLAKVGITVETDGAGNFSGLKDLAGNDITNSIGTDGAVFNEVEAALPEWDVGQIESFRTLMVDHANASFRGIPEDTPPDQVDKVIEKSVTNGATQGEVNLAAQEEAQDNHPSNSSATDATVSAGNANAAQEGGVIGDALDATQKALDAGATPAAAVDAGASSVNLGTPLLAAGLATTVCGIKKDVDVAAKSRVPKIMMLLIRHMTVVAAAAQELHSGKIHGATLAKLMALYNGDSSPAAKGTDAAMPFSQSAAWQRITGNVVNTNRSKPGYTPDLSISSRPSINAGTAIVNVVDNITNKTGLSAACDALNSPYSFVIQGALGTFQIITDIGSLGAEQVALTGGIIAVQEGIHHILLPEIIKYFMPVGLNGLEESVQLMNNDHVGGILAFGDYARRLGASPLTSAATNSVLASANQDQLKQQANMSWSARTFALDNPNSVLSRLAVALPTSNHQLALSFASYFTELPRTLLRNFGNLLFFRRAAADSVGTNPATAYGVTAYGFTDQELDKYPDMTANELYLKGTVTYTDPSTHQVYSGQRLALAGDPNTYEAGSNTDPNTNDLLHCFVNNFDTAASYTSDNPDPICGSVGNFDYSTVSPHPMDDTNVATAYCMGLIGSAPDNCVNQIKSQLQDDIGHFRQYILDVHVMHDYTSLAAKS